MSGEENKGNCKTCVYNGAKDCKCNYKRMTDSPLNPKRGQSGPQNGKERKMKIRTLIAALMITPVFPYAAIVAIVGGYGLSDVIDCLKLTWRNVYEEE